MQLEDEAFTTWMQRLTEARRNRENKVQRPYRNFRKPYNDKYEPSNDQVETDMESTRLNRNLNLWQKLMYN